MEKHTNPQGELFCPTCTNYTAERICPHCGQKMYGYDYKAAVRATRLVYGRAYASRVNKPVSRKKIARDNILTVLATVILPGAGFMYLTAFRRQLHPVIRILLSLYTAAVGGWSLYEQYLLHAAGEIVNSLNLVTAVLLYLAPAVLGFVLALRDIYCNLRKIDRTDI